MVCDSWDSTAPMYGFPEPLFQQSLFCQIDSYRKTQLFTKIKYIRAVLVQAQIGGPEPALTPRAPLRKFNILENTV